jgi:cysteine desulfurase/selenocysteine lyase
MYKPSAATFTFSPDTRSLAPTEIGVAFAKSEVSDQMLPWQGGGNMIQDVIFERTLYQPHPQHFEAGTGNIAGAFGLGVVIDYLTYASKSD